VRIRYFGLFANRHQEQSLALCREVLPGRCAKGIAWLRDTATEHISRMQEMRRIVEANGYSVGLVRADRVGYVTYEDEVQVVAEPFADTPTSA
jgi:hypothetical protein